MNRTVDRVAQLKTVQDEARELFTKKNADYGDSFATYGPIGVLIRIGDKINRLSSISARGITLINTESLRDTLIDLHNYSAMAVMLMDEKQPVNPRIEELKKTSKSPTAHETREIHKKKFALV